MLLLCGIGPLDPWSDFAGRSSTDTLSRSLGVIVSGDTPTFTLRFLDPCILPLGTQYNVIVIAFGVSYVGNLWVSALSWHLSCVFNTLFYHSVNEAASKRWTIC